MTSTRKPVAQAATSSDDRGRLSSAKSISAVNFSFDAIFNSSALGMAIVSPEGKLLRVNPELCRLLNRTEEDLLRAESESLAHPEELADEIAQWERMMNGEADGYARERRYRSFGEWRWFSVHTSVVRGEEDRPEYILVQALDINYRKENEMLLQKSESDLRAVFENTSTGFVLVNASGIVQLFNSKAEQIFLEYTGQRLEIDVAFVHKLPEYRQGPAQQMMEQALKGIAQNHELRIAAYNGIQYVVRLRENPITGPDGKVIGVCIALEDRTTIQQTSDALQEQQELLRLFIEHSPAAVAMFDTEMRYVMHNRRWLDDFQLDEESLIGRNHYEIFPGMEERLRNVHRRCLQGAIESNDNDYFIRKDGTLLWVKWDVRPWQKSSGGIAGIIVSVQLQNDKKETEEKLHLAYERINNLLHKAPLAVIEEDEDLRISGWSPYAEKMFGWKEEEVKGKRLRQFLFSGGEEHPVNLFNDDNGKPVAMRVRARDGRELSCNWYYSLLKNRSGKMEAGLSIVADVTEQETLQTELKEAELKFRNLVEKSQDGVYIIQEEQFAYVNPEFARIFGYTPEEMTNTFHVRTPIHPDDWQQVEDTMAAGIRGEIETAKYEVRGIRKNGEVFWVEIFGCLTLLNGNVAVIGTLRDISQRKQAAEALEESLRELSDYKVALDESSIVSITDPQGIITYANDNFCRASQFTKEELIGKSHRLLKSGYHPDGFFKNLWETITAGQIWRGEMRNRRKDGSFFWVTATLVPFLNEDGSIRQFVGIRQDITTRKLAETALQKSEANLHTVFDTTATSYILLDEQGQILSHNHAAIKWAKKQLGVDNALNRNIHDLFEEPARSRINQSLMEVLHMHTHISYEISYPQPDGTLDWFLVRMYPIHHQGEEVFGVLISINDITQSKLEEAERNKMTSELLFRNRELEQFGYIVSHNLRGPIANITGLTRLLQKTPPDDPNYERASGMLLTATAHLEEIIRDLNQILLVKRALTESKEHVDPEELVELITHTISEQLNNERAVINTDFSQLRKVYTIKSYLHSIFYNLITNSLKYRQNELRPVITISGKEEQQQVFFTFSDNGIGIDLKTNGENIFGLYKRFHGHTEGKGMGLYMVKTQVEGLGGTITVDSRPNRGTTFTVVLPVEKM